MKKSSSNLVFVLLLVLLCIPLLVTIALIYRQLNPIISDDVPTVSIGDTPEIEEDKWIACVDGLSSTFILEF